MTMKQLAINTIVVIATLAVAFLLWEFRQAVILFVFSLAVAAAARPFVERLIQRGIPSGLAIVLVYVLFLAILVIIFWAVGSSLVHEIQVLADRLAIAYDRIWLDWPKGTELQKMIVRQLPAPTEFYKSFSPQQQTSMLNGLLGITLSSANVVGEIFTVLVLSIYWSIDRVHFERLWLSLLPVESRARAREVWRNIEQDFGAYVRSELLQSIFAGLMLGVGLWLLGVPYPTLLALFGALAWFIPWLGGVLAVLPVTLAALPQGPLITAVATLYVIAVLFFQEFVIEPRFIRRRQFSSLLSILLIIAFIGPYGLMGLIVAPPLAAALELIFRYNLQNRQTINGTSTVERIAELHKRARRVRKTVAANDETTEPQILGLLSRLETLLDKADNLIGLKRTDSSIPRLPTENEQQSQQTSLHG